jgi:hypothetical protein
MTVQAGRDRYAKRHPQRQPETDSKDAGVASTPSPVGTKVGTALADFRRQRSAKAGTSKPRTTAEMLAEGMAAVERVDREQRERAAGLRS